MSTNESIWERATRMLIEAGYGFNSYKVVGQVQTCRISVYGIAFTLRAGNLIRLSLGTTPPVTVFSPQLQKAITHITARLCDDWRVARFRTGLNTFCYFLEAVLIEADPEAAVLSASLNPDVFDNDKFESLAIKETGFYL